MDLGEKRRTSQVNGLRKLPAVPLARSQQEEDEPGKVAGNKGDDKTIGERL